MPAGLTDKRFKVKASLPINKDPKINSRDHVNMPKRVE
jgi:hypothetical protein